MAPLNPNTTGRVYFDYITGNQATSQEHTLMMRFAVGAGFDLGDAQEEMLAFLQSYGATEFADGWRIQGIRLSQPLQDFSLPFTLIPTLAAFVGTGGSLSPSQEAREWTHQGRSFTSGRRVDLSLYGIVENDPANFRIIGGPGTFPTKVATAATNLNLQSAAGYFVAIDGTPATWYPYLNMNYNSYWERRIRSV